MDLNDQWACVRPSAEGVVVSIRLQPNARRSGVKGFWQQSIRIAVGAPPIEGRANTALLSWLSTQLDVPKNEIRWVRGQHSRDKRLWLPISQRVFIERIRSLLGS
ncbi:MAG: hypothetical protein CMH53_03495 [Myxococcales bacterium]|nr:hypothetical protein [Myxococcales bacterium]